MRRKRSNLAGWGLALVAVAAVITAGTVYAAKDSGPDGSSSTSAGKGLTKEQQRSILISLAEQPETRFVRGPMTLKQAAADNIFAAPPSMVFKPQSCATFLADALGSMDKFDGWLQFGSRINPTRNDNFIQAVVTVPDGADQKLLDRIRDEALKCRNGTLTLEGKATGNLSVTERRPLDLAGAKTFSMTANSRFPFKKGTAEADLVRRFEMPPDAQLLLDDELTGVENSNFVAIGNTLIFVMDADEKLSNSLASIMHGRVKAALEK